jgi:hypothetical protein
MILWGIYGVEHIRGPVRYFCVEGSLLTNSVDIDGIKIISEGEGATAGRKTYNYRVRAIINQRLYGLTCKIRSS